MSTHQLQFDSDALEEKGLGLRFKLPQLGEYATGFVIRYEGKAYAYVNQCAHLPTELDWKEGEFFTVSKDFLICATHGAQYEPHTGHCVYGPCKGRRLHAIPVTEMNQQVTIHLEGLGSHDGRK